MQIITTGKRFDFNRVLNATELAVTAFLREFDRGNAGPDNVAKVLATFEKCWLAHQIFDHVGEECVAVEGQDYRLETYLIRETGPVLYVGLSQEAWCRRPHGLNPDEERRAVASLIGLDLATVCGFHPARPVQRVAIGLFPFEIFGLGIGPISRFD